MGEAPQASLWINWSWLKLWCCLLGLWCAQHFYDHIKSDSQRPVYVWQLGTEIWKSPSYDRTPDGRIFCSGFSDACDYGEVPVSKWVRAGGSEKISAVLFGDCGYAVVYSILSAIFLSVRSSSVPYASDHSYIPAVPDQCLLWFIECDYRSYCQQKATVDVISFYHTDTDDFFQSVYVQSGK